MNVMNREFTTSEKILLVILSVLLIGLLYYRFVYVTTEDMMRDLDEKKQVTKADLDTAAARLERLQQMQRELDEVDLDVEEASRMESYNNSKNETAFLNQVLRGVPDYSISFSEVTRNGDQIRRTFSLRFVAKSYKEAVAIVDELCSGEYRCQVDDINYSLSDNKDIYINLTATFFETMVGGTPDSALPKDESEDNAVTSEGISIDDFR